MNIIERILRHLPNNCTDEDCWVTDYTPLPNKYVKLYGENGNTRPYLHRLVWEAHNAEPIPENMVVRHTCDNPQCCNPNHLLLGTMQDNVDDMFSRGRNPERIVFDRNQMEILRDEDSRLFNADFGESGGLRNGLVLNNFHGFRVYTSSNLPSVGTGPGTTGSANQNSNYGAIVAGHDSAVATAEQINKTETYRDPDSFADIVRGMHLYGRKILRPEGIVTAKYNAA